MTQSQDSLPDNPGSLKRLRCCLGSRCERLIFSLPRRVGEKITYLFMDVGAADKAEIQLVRLRQSSGEVKSSHISCSRRIRNDTTSWASNQSGDAWGKRPSRPEDFKLQWEPSIDIEQGLKKTIEYFTSNLPNI